MVHSTACAHSKDTHVWAGAQAGPSNSRQAQAVPPTWRCSTASDFLASPPSPSITCAQQSQFPTVGTQQA